MYVASGAIGEFATYNYWSSPEYGSSGYAWYQSFANGIQTYTNKDSTLFVRAVRAF
jgi:hypothetical protein